MTKSKTDTTIAPIKTMKKTRLNKENFNPEQNNLIALTSEELKLVENYRKEQEELNSKQKLEDDFKQAVLKAQSAISVHLLEAKEALGKAVSLSEKYGVPFESTVVNLDKELYGSGRRYIPENKQWENVDINIFYKLNVPVYERNTGWEYWNTSSLTC